MEAGRLEALTALLSQTEAAHGAYEAAELGGVYDPDWPRWYATWAVGHGIDGLLDQAVTSEELAGRLARSWQDSRRADPRPTEPWATWTARELLGDGDRHSG